MGDPMRRDRKDGESEAALAPLGLADAPRLLRRIDRMQRMADQLRSMGKAGAARQGIGPLEYDAILSTRFTEVGSERVDELWGKLMGPKF